MPGKSAVCYRRQREGSVRHSGWWQQSGKGLPAAHHAPMPCSHKEMSEWLRAKWERGPCLSGGAVGRRRSYSQEEPWCCAERVARERCIVGCMCASGECVLSGLPAPEVPMSFRHCRARAGSHRVMIGMCGVREGQRVPVWWHGAGGGSRRRWRWQAKKVIGAGGPWGGQAGSAIVFLPKVKRACLEGV